MHYYTYHYLFLLYSAPQNYTKEFTMFSANSPFNSPSTSTLSTATANHAKRSNGNSATEPR